MSDVLKTIKGNYNFEKFKRDVVVDTKHRLNFRCTTCLTHDRNSWRWSLAETLTLLIIRQFGKYLVSNRQPKVNKEQKINALLL